MFLYVRAVQLSEGVKKAEGNVGHVLKLRVCPLVCFFFKQFPFHSCQPVLLSTAVTKSGLMSWFKHSEDAHVSSARHLSPSPASLLSLLLEADPFAHYPTPCNFSSSLGLPVFCGSEMTECQACCFSCI